MKRQTRMYVANLSFPLLRSHQETTTIFFNSWFLEYLQIIIITGMEEQCKSVNKDQVLNKLEISLIAYSLK